MNTTEKYLYELLSDYNKESVLRKLTEEKPFMITRFLDFVRHLKI